MVNHILSWCDLNYLAQLSAENCWPYYDGVCVESAFLEYSTMIYFEFME